jgi:DNA-binding NtrC family response regulator
MMPPPPCGKIQPSPAKVRGRVLIVDDEALVRWSLASALGAGGFDTVSATSATEALLAAHAFPSPAAVLIDLDMHDTDVRLLVGQILELAPACHVLALTTSRPDAPERAQWRTFTQIRKPFDLAHVVRLVQQTVA